MKLKSSKNSFARKILFDRGISMTEAAERCGVSRPFLSMVLHGKKNPSPKVKQGLSKLLRISQKELFGNSI